MESPFEREYSQHCEREALKEMRKSAVNVIQSPGRSENQLKKPKSESLSLRSHDDTDDVIPAAKRPRKGKRDASHCPADGKEVAQFKTVKCLRSWGVTCLVGEEKTIVNGSSMCFCSHLIIYCSC